MPVAVRLVAAWSAAAVYCRRLTCSCPAAEEAETAVGRSVVAVL